MQIILKSLTLDNFKGGSITADFSPDVTNVYGANKAGKTRLFDAFTWLLWGKDSAGAELGEKVKPLDQDNNIIHRLVSSVDGVILLNGKEILLKREYKENWVKPRGGTEERMDGHVSLFYIDGVKVQKQDYDKQVNDICDEQTFKILSNPSVFPSMHWEEQRKILFTLAGSMEPYEICKDHKDIIGLLDRMGKLKSKEYKERLAAQKTEVNKAIADTTPRIEELSNTAHPKEDWDDLQRQVAELDSLILKQEEERASVAKQNEAANLQKSQIMEQVYTERDRLSQLKAQHKEAFYADYTRQVQEYNSLLVEYTTKEQKRTLVASIISKMKAEAATVVADLERLRGEYTTIAEQEFSGLPEGADTCHTCGQALPTATVEDLNTQALTIFNTSKESKLKSIVEKGAALKEKLAQLEKGYAELHSQLPQTQVAPAKPVAPEYTEVETEEMKAVRDRIASLEAQRDAVVSTPVDNTALLELRKQRDALMSRLYVKDAIASNNARIKELKEHLKANAQRKAEIEQEEDLLAQYNRIMVDHMESKVSGMFSFVRFKLFKKLINEGEVATCELLNDGVPYSIVNTAGKVQAGLDVIATLQKHSDTYAPIFIDDRELVTDIPDMPCQVINLYVSPQDNQLRITQ